MKKPYEDVPGTYVLDGEHSAKGYNLNMCCMSLIHAKNREEFSQDEAAYCDKYDLSPEQKQAVLDRDWLAMVRLGGNIYYTYKIGNHDRKSMQYIGASFSGVTEDEFKQMMLDGGRSPAGNLRKGGDTNGG